MKLLVDESIAELGIESVVIGIARDVDPNAPLPDSFLKKQKDMEDWALGCTMDDVLDLPIVRGYTNLLKRVKRNVKKNPPTVPALIRNIQHRGSIPHINSVIDIYNVESLHSLLAIGGHDLDKVDAYIEFTVNREEGVFLPILSSEKHVAETDYVYRDAKGIMAWLDVRDGENYKFDDETKNAIFIIQGNAKTSVEYRLEALERIQNDLTACMPNVRFKAHVVHAGMELDV